MKKIKILAVIVLCLMLALSLTACFNHIEDTNGDDDFSLVTITDSEIASGATNCLSFNEIKTTFNNVTTYKVGKFSGVTTLETIRVGSNSKNIEVQMNVTSGNCRLVLVKDGAIVHDFDIHGSESIPLDSGIYYLRLAGESATISFLQYTID